MCVCVCVCVCPRTLSITVHLCLVCPGVCEEYSVPYYDRVQVDPSLKEMRAVVAEAQCRPHIEERWTTNEVSGWVGPGRGLVEKEDVVGSGRRQDLVKK